MLTEHQVQILVACHKARLKVIQAKLALAKDTLSIIEASDIAVFYKDIIKEVLQYLEEDDDVRE